MSTKIRWISYAVIAVSLIVLMRSLPLGDGIAALRAWVDGLGVWGPVVFALIYVVAVIAMVPASLLTLAAGATFGLVVGTLTVAVGANIGAALALLISRYLARRKVERFAQQRPKFAVIDQAIDEGGWKIVALLRLSPAIPFNVQNYLYGLTSIGFWTCVLTSSIAMLPGTIMYVYLGYAAGSITGGRDGRSPAEWALLGVGLLATIAVTVYITRLARKKLQEQTKIEDDAAAEASNDDQKPSPEMPASRFGTIVAASLAVLLAALAGVTLANPDVIMQTARRFLPLGPPAVEMTEEYQPNEDGPTFDHSAFDAQLKQHVDADGWVDYDGLQQDASQLDAYLESLAKAPFEELGRNEKLALLINAYNAFTLRLILDHWPLKSIKDIPAANRWEAVRWQVGDNTWSLNQIEHEQIRPKFKEPRIHFALVCAAVGCPPLAPEAYTADRIESQLERQAEYVHAHETWLKVDANSAQLTALYKWYESDFLQSAPSLLAYAERYSPAVDQMVRRNTIPQISFLPYDWDINDVSNQRPR